MAKSSMSVNFFNPAVGKVCDLGDGNKVLRLGDYPNEISLFFDNASQLNEFARDIQKQVRLREQFGSSLASSN